MSAELGQEGLLQALPQAKKPEGVLAALTTSFVSGIATWCEIHLTHGTKPEWSAARHRDDAKTGHLLKKAERFPFNPEAHLSKTFWMKIDLCKALKRPIHHTKPHHNAPYRLLNG